MKKYWPLILLAVLITVMLIYARPMPLKEIIKINPDDVFAIKKQWDGDNWISSDGDISAGDYKRFIKALEKRKFGKNIGNKYFSDNGMDSVTFLVTQNGVKKLNTLIIFYDGTINIDGKMYNCSKKDDEYLEIVDWIHSSVHELLLLGE